MTKPKVILSKWRKRIEKARKRGGFTDTEKHMSYDWAKCAVGERDCLCEKVIPKNKGEVLPNFSKGDLVRQRLFAKVVDLGGDFHAKVYMNNFDEALKILEKIEKIPKERFYR